MPIFRRMLLWFRALFSRRGVERDMAREMRAHIEMETEHNVGLGLPPDEARRRAMVEFGGVERFKQAVRAERGTGWLDALGTDLRVAVRTLAKRPAFTTVVVLTIAVGIGATTAVYSWANWALFRPVPGVRDPGGAVGVGIEKSMPGGGMSPAGISYPNFVDLAATVQSFSQLAGYTNAAAQLSAPGIEPVQFLAVVVLGDYFGVLGVVPRLGRAFSAAELHPASADRVVVISDSVWRTAFGGRRDALGRLVDINGTQFTVIGVAPPGFRGTDRRGDRDLWFPPSAFGPLLHHPIDVEKRGENDFQNLIGRLRPGVTPQQAQNETNRRLNILVAQYPGINDIFKDYHAVVSPDLGAASWYRGTLVDVVHLQLGIVALVFLIACANVANLLLLRGVRRRAEVAVRRALGASAARVVGQHLVEGVLLSFGGGAVGLVVAAILARVFSSTSLGGMGPMPHLALDGRVLTAAAVLCLGTGLLFGLAPGLVALRHDPMRHLKDGTGSHSGARAPARSALTVVQIAAAMALVVGAVLLGRTLYNMAHVDLGFDPNQVSVYWINARPQGYAPDRVQAIRRTILEQASAIPGVQSAAIASTLPGMGAYIRLSLHTLGDTSKAASHLANMFIVSPAFFRSLHITIVRGRPFTTDEFDDTTSHSAIISLTAAHALFGETDPVGRQFDASSYAGAEPKTVVGVTADVHVEGPRDADRLALYIPVAGGMLANSYNPFFALVIRSSRPEADFRHQAQTVFARVAPGLPLPTAQSFATITQRSIGDSLLFARLVGVLALLAAVLATIGLYSVVAFAVAERTHEIGIRMALGAREAAVVKLVVRQSALLTIVGLAIGTGGAIALARLLASKLFGVTPLDPSTYVAAAAIWALLATLASIVPARAAARVNPVEALRYE
jgi:putative ABC transport system permease protein